MHHYVGLMSGTSLDGVDAALVRFEDSDCTVIGTFYEPYPEPLRQALLDLHKSGYDELERAQLLSNQLAQLYANAVKNLLYDFAAPVKAIGCHGQTVRHRPELGFTLQLNNPALLAELTNLTVVADFRSRDIAAGGQGAPLVPAFHKAVFGHPNRHRVIINIGGISNLTNLPANDPITGFDCGPGNLLMDAWCQRHTGASFDRNGDWGATGTVIHALLDGLLAHGFFSESPPKSTGRDIFNMQWLEQHLLPTYTPQDVQTTLLELSAICIADSLERYCQHAEEAYICGGGVHNSALIARLHTLLPTLPITNTDALGIPADWVEAAAFAWLAKQTLEGKPGNLPDVTGAAGLRILGAIFPA